MKTPPRTSSPRNRRGITLVETLAGSALLATLLVSILLANGRLAVQAARARGQAQACGVLSDLLDRWWLDANTVPRSGSGRVPAHPDWTWRAQKQHNPDAARLDSEVITVEVASTPAAGTEQVARVDIMLPLEVSLLPDKDANATTASR